MRAHRPGVLPDEIARLGVRLLDDAHIAWRIAQVECAEALRSWFEASAGGRADASMAYRAALDREEAAAHDLERLAMLAGEAA
jgi:hypothetical protein